MLVLEKNKGIQYFDLELSVNELWLDGYVVHPNNVVELLIDHGTRQAIRREYERWSQLPVVDFHTKTVCVLQDLSSSIDVDGVLTASCTPRTTVYTRDDDMVATINSLNHGPAYDILFVHAHVGIFAKREKEAWHIGYLFNLTEITLK